MRATNGKNESMNMRWFLTLVFTFLGVYLGFRYILPLILPFVFAYFLSWMIRPSTEFLYRKLKISRLIGGAISLLILISILGTGIFFLIKILIKQLIAFVKNAPIYLEIMADKIDTFCEYCDNLFGLSFGTVRAVVDDNLMNTASQISKNVMPELTQRSISITIGFIGCIGIILIVIISTLLLAKDIPELKERLKEHSLYQHIHLVTTKLADAGIAYLRSQLIISVVVAILCIIGLSLIKNDYAFLLGIGIAILDAFPILGSGIILIPWAIVMLLQGNIFAAATLFTVYLLCQIVREILEPKLIGNRIGIRPIFTLMSIYIGIKLFSFPGFVLGPIGLVIIITVVGVIKDMNARSNQKDQVNMN